MSEALITQENIEHKILLIRGQKVMIDRDIAELYGVETKRLNEQVKRNSERFPENFMFQLTEQEKTEVVAICDHLADLKFSYQLPFAFTEYGVAMLASVLNSERAVKMSIFIINTFVRLRQIMFTHKELAQKLEQLEKRVDGHDENIKELIYSIRQLMSPLPADKKKIGFSKE